MVFLVIFGIVIALGAFIWIKDKVWDNPQSQISLLKSENERIKSSTKKEFERIQNLHKDEVSALEHRLRNSDSLQIQGQEFADIVASFYWEELSELYNKEFVSWGIPKEHSNLGNTKESVKLRFREAVLDQYKYRYLLYLYPELKNEFDGTDVVDPDEAASVPDQERRENLFEIVSLLRETPKKTEEMIYWKNRVTFLEKAHSNLSAIPYMAGIMADYETYGIEHLAKELNWGRSVQRLEKVKSIRDIRKDAQAIVQKNKEAQYQLAYLIQMYPVLEEVIDAEFNSLPIIKVSELSEYDCVRDYISKEEYSALSVTERNQLALDRYIHSSTRSKWQIGRDYELFVGFKYTQKGYQVDYFGSYMGLEDLGRDLIAKKGDQILIIQCKYWSSKKQIHENHIHQLSGTINSYCFEHNCDSSKVKGLLVTNIELTEKAKKIASYLNIRYVENFETGEFPRIKCNIGRDDNGEPTKIYHLPFDQQYDSTKIEKDGEFFAWTVSEAEEAGFRRAFKWFGTQ